VGFGFLGTVASGNRTLFIRIRLDRIRQAGSCDGRSDSRAYHLSRIEMGHGNR
jgi:hypothetical protein